MTDPILELEILAAAAPPRPERIARAESEPLNDEALADVLSKLPPQAVAQTAELSIRDATKPPPRTGDTVVGVFPPAEQRELPDAAPTGPLQVERISPEGAVPAAGRVTVTFDRAVVPLGWSGDPGIALNPRPDGEWRALGTKVLVFEAEDRMPAATRYEVEVPAGWGAPNGSTLQTTAAAAFETPPLTLMGGYPTQMQGRGSRPVIVLLFDQRVDPVALGEHVILRSAPGHTFDFEVLASDVDRWRELDADAARAVDDARVGTWVAIRPTDGLPSGRITVEVPVGAPSAEGPLTSTKPAAHGFDIAGPLEVRNTNNGNRRPQVGIRFTLTNVLRRESIDETAFVIEPEPLSRPSISGWGSELYLDFGKRGSATYTVTLPEDLEDTFGQKLSGERTFSFTTTAADPALISRVHGAMTVHADARRVLGVTATNVGRLIVTVSEVTPADWPAFQQWSREHGTNTGPLPGRELDVQVIDLELEEDVPTEVEIDISWALDAGACGHRVVHVRPSQLPTGDHLIGAVRCWLQATRIGASIYGCDPTRVMLWVNDLATGAPLPGCSVTAVSHERVPQLTEHGEFPAAWSAVQTDEAGICVTEDAALYVLRSGDDTCILPRNWSQPAVGPAPFACHVFDDRGIYRPTETVTLEGWARSRSADESLVPIGGSAGITVRDSGGDVVATQQVELSESGRFRTHFVLPDTPSLGPATAQIDLRGGHRVAHQFDIQEFRRPEYEVSAAVESGGTHLLGDEITFAARAAYYTGEALENLEASWKVAAKATTYSPAGWSGFSFGRQRPSWMWWLGRQSRNAVTEEVSGYTDSEGTHRFAAVVAAVDPPCPVSVTASASVTDINRQTWSASCAAVVHPSSIYVGLRIARTFVALGEVSRLDLVVTDVDGNTVAGRRVVVTLERADVHLRQGQRETDWIEVARTSVASAQGPITIDLEPQEAGEHRIVVTTGDDHDRIARSELSLWVAGRERSSSRVQGGKLTLVPERMLLHAGEDAHIAVSAPFDAGRGLVVVRRGTIRSTMEFDVSDGFASVSLPIGENDLPGVDLFVEVVGMDDDGSPAFAVGELSLDVADVHRRLDVDVRVDPDSVEPGGKATVAVEIRDRAGAALPGAEATVWVVDEAILALTGYDTPDPIAAFYVKPPNTTNVVYSRTYALRAPTDQRVEGGVGGVADGAPEMYRLMAPSPRAAAAFGGAPGGGGPPQPEPIAMRSDFNPLAVFDGVVTGEDGRAVLQVELPDNLTRYRVMVNAHDGAQCFGFGESSLTARLPLTIRASPPRFANFGDEFELGVVVHNASTARCDVDVAVRAENLALARGDHDGRRVSLPAGERAEVRFDARTASAGEVTFQVVADTISSADAAEGSFPVYTPATTEAFATYGEVDDGAIAQLIEPPADSFPQFGGLEITTSSTALQALTDAVVHLASYPFDCVEQRASRVLAITALKDVLGAFAADGMPDERALQESVARDLAALQREQRADGGWGFWMRGSSWPIVTIHATYALVNARDKGYPIAGATLQRAQDYLRKIEQFLDTQHYSVQTRLVLRAFASFVLTQSGEDDSERARAVVSSVATFDELPLDAVAWCLAVLHGTSVGDQLLRHATNRVAETESVATFATTVDASGAHLLLSSNRRTDALMLRAMMDQAPDSSLIPKTVHGLLAHRRRGHWGSTQENAHVLLALDRYFERYEATTPDFVARAWLGEHFAGEHHFAGRTTERHHIEVPMSEVVRGDSPRLVLQKDGPGRMYYRIGMRHAPRDLAVQPLDRGFVVERRYEGADDPEDVGRREDGTWVVKAGTRVRVTVSMVATARRHHVALVDPLPAGFEILNPDLAVTEDLPEEQPRVWSWWWRRWFEHQNLRDERAEAFSSLLRAGQHDFVYYARATTVGTFVVPPPRAEEMYSPEVFGRGAATKLVVFE